MSYRLVQKAVDGDNFSGEPQWFSPEQDDMTLFTARQIFEEREKSVPAGQPETTVSSVESAPIQVKEEQVEMSPRESVPSVVKLPSETESYCVKKEENPVEPRVAKSPVAETAAAAAPVAGVKMREAVRQPAPIPGGSPVSRPASRQVAPRQNPLFIGAALLALLAFSGLGLYLYSQRQESPGDVRAATTETPVGSASQSPRATSDTADLPLTASKSENQTQPNETVENQPASEISAAEIESGGNESVENATTGNEQTELKSSLNNWVTATNARDVEGQMSYYAPKVKAYYQARNASPELVRAEKTRAFARAKVIDIQTSEPEIALSRDGRGATMQFRKKYAIKEGGKTRNGEVLQELQWVKSGGEWKIVSERDVKVISR